MLRSMSLSMAWRGIDIFSISSEYTAQAPAETGMGQWGTPGPSKRWCPWSFTLNQVYNPKSTKGIRKKGYACSNIESNRHSCFSFLAHVRVVCSFPSCIAMLAWKCIVCSVLALTRRLAQYEFPRELAFLRVAVDMTSAPKRGKHGRKNWRKTDALFHPA